MWGSKRRPHNESRNIEGAHMQNKRGLRVMATIILLQRGNTQANLPYFPFLAETG
jgi:hypothetical protein